MPTAGQQNATDLAAWLRAQLDADERKTAAMEREEDRVRTAPIFQGYPPTWLAGVDIFVSSKRWRAEIAAKQRIIDKCERTIEYEDYGHALARDVLSLLALPYADRPGYRAEWQPR